MKKSLYSVLALTCLLLLLTNSSLLAKGYGSSVDKRQQMSAAFDTGDTSRMFDQPVTEYLDDQEKHDLLHMFEEEKLARDVYSSLYSYWGHWTFDHIAVSEQKHLDAVTALLNRYGVALPASAQEEASFDSEELQQLYQELVDQGTITLVDGFQVGATIEDLDIYDLQHAIALSDNLDITTVYENLMRGSRNHLRAFVDQLNLNDAEYEAQYLSQEEIDAITSTERERGRNRW